MSHKLRLLKTGYGELCLAEWEDSDGDGGVAVMEAERVFNENLTAGRMAFRLDGRGDTSPIRSFLREAEEILIVPAIQGG